MLSTEAAVPVALGSRLELFVDDLLIERLDGCTLRLDEQPTGHLVRYTLRIDGFVSLNAPYRDGERLTRPATYEGSELVVNFSTGAAGGLQVEVQDLAGQALGDLRRAGLRGGQEDQRTQAT